ncbi:MAG: NUDIX domain-containing protein [Thermoplasmata archaeon]
MELRAYFVGGKEVEGLIGDEIVFWNAAQVRECVRGAIASHISFYLPQYTVAITSHIDLFLTSDFVKLSPQRSKIILPEIVCSQVVSCFVIKNGKLLLLKRSSRVGSFQGYWATISGYIEKGELPLRRAYIELLEEGKLRKVRLIKKGKIVFARDKGRVFAVHPFLFETKSDVEIDWEHTEYRWINPVELTEYQTVPKLREAFLSVWASTEQH